MAASRSEGRSEEQFRGLTIETDVNRYAEGSVLVKAGNTHVLCTASFSDSVPKWLEGKERGWVTAEYSMLPRSTHTRSKRDREKVSGRTQEIQRLIGRSLRGIVDLKKLGENSVIVDCDVLQADGGTRTASITGGCVALIRAIKKMQENGLIPKDSQPWTDTVSAISIGMHSGKILTDLDYDEDSTCEVDMNFVMRGNGEFIEVQGTGEGASFSTEHLNQMTAAAQTAGRAVREIQLKAIG